MRGLMLPALVLALMGSACVGEMESSGGGPESRSASAHDSTATAAVENAEEDPPGVAAEPINEACLEACLEGNRRAVALCMRLRSPGARRLCIEAANGVMATCIAACPDE